MTEEGEREGERENGKDYNRERENVTMLKARCDNDHL